MCCVPLGANQRADGAWEFLVWAPGRQKVRLHLFGSRESPAILTVFRNSIVRSRLMIFNFDAREVEWPSVGRKGRWMTELH
jgi:hypothetical protein